MQQYQYDGPVMRFDDCVQHRWKATTVAPTEAKRLDAEHKNYSAR